MARCNPSPGRSLSLQAYGGLMIQNDILPDVDEWGLHAQRQLTPRVVGVHQEVGPPTGRFNCHGFVFASSRTQILMGVEEIMEADLYASTSTPKPGDVVVYRRLLDPTEIEHTGVVAWITDLQAVFVLSK